LRYLAGSLDLLYHNRSLVEAAGIELFHISLIL